MTTISATTILSSAHTKHKSVLTGILAHYPRWIHAEGRTHRLLNIAEDLECLPATPSVMEDPNLSRNAASSRAIPVAKMIADIEADPAVPVFWGKNVAGMQAHEELAPAEAAKARDCWLHAMEAAIDHAKAMCKLGIDEEGRVIGAHKQIVNRMLEPYMHIRVFISATEWSNFLALRIHSMAEPHIQILASAIKHELDKQPMQVLRPGEWHLPWVQREDLVYAHERYQMPIDYLRKLSTARSASTSYLTVDSKIMAPDVAVGLHDRLVGATPLHASPAEHPAQADDHSGLGWFNREQHRNYIGFRQYRAMLPNDTL